MSEVINTTLTYMAPSRLVEKDSNSPAYVTGECDFMYRRSQVCRDLRGGFPVMMAKATTYLPQYEGEHNKDYEDRIKTASFRNFYGQAVASILGKLFGNPPTLNDDVPEAIATDLKDADLNGNDWTIVAEDLVSHALDEGVSWLLVDYHTVENAQDLTLAEEKEMGLRPYWVVVPQSRVLGVRYTQFNNVYIISQFRFYVEVTEPDGEFGEKTIEQIRVVEPGRYRTYSRDPGEKDSAWALTSDTPNTLGMVPVSFIALDKKGTFMSAPPLENLAYMNVEHFQIRSDQRRALSVASFPILAQYGVDAKAGTAKIGPMVSIAFEDPKSKMEWVESMGIHLLAGDRELVRLETQMRTFGLSFENPGMYATATGRNIDASDAIAPIQRWAYRLRDCLNSALWYTSRWRKLNAGGTVNVNTSFLKNQITVEELKLLLEALKAKALTPESFLDRMQDYGLLSNELDPATEVDELTRLAEEAVQRLIEQKKAENPDGDPGTTPPAGGNRDAQEDAE